MTTAGQGALHRLIAGAPPHSPAIMLWKHFYTDDPRELARHTVDFYHQYRLSMAKVMPDVPLLFDEGVLSSWKQVAHLRNVEQLGRATDYVATVRHTRAALEDEDVLMVTVFSPLTMLGIWCGADVFDDMSKSENRRAAHALLGSLTRGVRQMVADIVAAGADAVYFSSWGADVLDRAGYAEFGVPYDLGCLQGADDAQMRILHVHGARGIDLRSFDGYPVDAIGWSEVDTGISLVDGAAAIGGRVPMGGIDERPGEFADDVLSATREHLARINAQLDGRFIAAPGCSLPDTTSDEVMSALRAAVAGESAPAA